MMMKYSTIVTLLLISNLLFVGCENSGDPQATTFTGNEVIYNLIPGNSQFNLSGTINFKETTDNGIVVEIQVQESGSGGAHPVHLHFGTLETPDANIAALLSPVDATTGVSVTTLSLLDDQTPFTYNQLLGFDGSVKIHLDDGANKDVVLAATNIGINASMDISDIAVCSSEKEAI